MTPPIASDIRAWARQQGLPVSERGRLSQDIVAAYDKAHAKVSALNTVSASKATRPSATAKARPAAKKGTVASPDAAKEPESLSNPPASGRAELEQRDAELENQVLSLTERLDAAVTALTKRSRPFSLPTRK